MDTRISLIVLAILFEIVAIIVDLFSDGSAHRTAIIRRTAMICGGCVVGGLVGFLFGTSSLLTFGDVFSRGSSLQGLQVVLRPAAVTANNYMLAGSIVGIVGAMGLIYLKPQKTA